MAKITYSVTGADNDLWGYDVVCVGNLSKCRQFVANSPYSFEDGVIFDRIQLAKSDLWRIIEDTGDNVIGVGWLKRGKF